ncbi:MAG: hypothetical protein N2C12_17800, partial [Planctomycetales bacterium]
MSDTVLGQSRKSGYQARLASSLIVALLVIFSSTHVFAQTTESDTTPISEQGDLPSQLSDWVNPDNFGSTLQMMLVLGVVSLAPALLL